MTHNHLHCGHFLREAVRQRLGTRLEVPQMFGVALHEYMSKQSQYISFMNVPFVVRFCVDAMTQKGVSVLFLRLINRVINGRDLSCSWQT